MRLPYSAYLHVHQHAMPKATDSIAWLADTVTLFVAALSNKGDSGCTSSNKCSACEGDCDSDADCATGHTCFQRSNKEKVYGCTGGGPGDLRNHDYCSVLPLSGYLGPYAKLIVTWGCKCERTCSWQCSCKSNQRGCKSQDRCANYQWDQRSKTCELYASPGKGHDSTHVR